VLLADEINRAPPRTQSALLEAMAEHQVTVDGITHPLPASVLRDRDAEPGRSLRHLPAAGFAARPLPAAPASWAIRTEDAERALLSGSDRRDLIARSEAVLSADDVRALRDAVSEVHASEALIAYVQKLMARSRHHPGVRVGLSPRAGLALLRAARAHALLLGRAHALPEDVQTLVHRRRRASPGGGCRWRRRRRHWRNRSCMRWRWIDDVPRPSPVTSA
jgi:MoxR-like ATPase